MDSHYPVVAVGGGPAGISLAIECIELGLKARDILILEKGPKPIWAIRKFYPEKKMTLANYKGLPTETHGHLKAFPDLTKTETLVYYDDLIKKYDLQLVLNAEVFKIIKKQSIFQIHYNRKRITAESVLLGIGILGRPNKPTYRLPAKLRKQLLFDITSQETKNLKVLVVGGGDSSSEYCQALKLENNELTLAYRRDSITRMMDVNLKAVENMVKSGDLRLRLSCDIQEIQEKEGKPFVVFKEAGVFPPEEFDVVVYAIGGTTPVNFLKTAGVSFEGNAPKYSESGATNVPGLYLGGDLVAGRKGGSIITAYNSCFRTSKEMVERIKGSS